MQETILKAWDKWSSFEQGTNLDGWLFTILRNELFSQHRKRSREVEDVDGSNANSLIALPDQVDRLELQDLSAALARLAAEQREALILVGVEGLSYEDAAKAAGIATGTMKSRVNRARTRLAELLAIDPEDAGGKRLKSWRL